MDAAQFETIEEIAEYVRDAYRQQRHGVPGGTTPKLDLAVVRPSPLIERAIELSGTEGITDAELRRRLSPMAKARFETALADLKLAGFVVRSLERRPDKTGRDRNQVVWRSERNADPRREA